MSIGDSSSPPSQMQATVARSASKWKTGRTKARWKTANAPCGKANATWSSLYPRLLTMDALGIALIGCGTVGGGVAKLLLEKPDRLTARAGRPLELRRVVVRDPNKPRAAALPRDVVTTDFRSVLRDPRVQVVAEL